MEIRSLNSSVFIVQFPSIYLLKYLMTRFPRFFENHFPVVFIAFRIITEARIFNYDSNSWNLAEKCFKTRIPEIFKKIVKTRIQ